jgi:hypothetical protein
MSKLKGSLRSISFEIKSDWFSKVTLIPVYKSVEEKLGQLQPQPSNPNPQLWRRLREVGGCKAEMKESGGGGVGGCGIFHQYICKNITREAYRINSGSVLNYNAVIINGSGLLVFPSETN